MATEITGRGDPQRSLVILWSTEKRPTRGPTPDLHHEYRTRTAHSDFQFGFQRVLDGIVILARRRQAEHSGQ